MIKLHTNGNTWQYTLDIGKLRLVFKRVKRINALGQRVPHFKIG